LLELLQVALQANLQIPQPCQIDPLYTQANRQILQCQIDPLYTGIAQSVRLTM